MPKTSKNQKGFAHLTAIGLVLIIAVAGFAGWRVWQVRKEGTKPAANSSSAPTETTTPTETKLTIPDGYIKYENKDLGFSFAYPKEYGTVTTSTMLLGEIGVEGIVESSTPSPQYTPGVEGNISVTTATLEFGFGTYKYGPKIKVDSNKLIATEVNPADQYNKVDSVFKDKNGKAARSQDNAGLKIFVISGSDEGTLTNSYIFVTKQKAHQLVIPNFHDPYLFTGEGKAIDQTKYNELKKNILDSIRSL